MSTNQQITYNFPTNDPHQQSTHFLSTLLWYSGSACGPLKINIFSTSPFFPFPINSSLETGKCLWPTKDQYFPHINIFPTSYQIFFIKGQAVRGGLRGHGDLQASSFVI